MTTWAEQNKSTSKYSSLITYAVGNSVSYLGNLYVCILEALDKVPTNVTYWKGLYTNPTKNDTSWEYKDKQ